MTVRDAFTAAKEELGMATPSDGDTGMPPVEPEPFAAVEQSDSPSLEQPTADEGGYSEAGQELADLLAETLEDNQSGSEETGGPAPGSDEFWNLEVELDTVNGPETLTIRDLADGMLRQRDYTQKTQQLAEERKRLEQAEEFYSHFEQNPAEFIRSLAVQAGMLEKGARPVTDIPGAKIPTPSEIEAMVEARVRERLESDPEITEGKRQAQVAKIDRRFDELSKQFNMPLSQDLRIRILERAVADKTSDFGGVLAKMILEAQRRQADTARVRESAPARPRPGGAMSSIEEPAERPSTVAEAFAQAKAELQQ